MNNILLQFPQMDEDTKRILEYERRVWLSGQWQNRGCKKGGTRGDTIIYLTTMLVYYIYTEPPRLGCQHRGTSPVLQMGEALRNKPVGRSSALWTRHPASVLATEASFPQPIWWTVDCAITFHPKLLVHKFHSTVLLSLPILLLIFTHSLLLSSTSWWSPVNL